MEIQQARLFLAVAHEGSLSGAARRLYRTQPTVTMAVQKLERELGAKLFERIGHGVRLTNAGRQLRESIGTLVDQWERATGSIPGSNDPRARGPIRIAASEAAILYLLPGPIRSFLRRHPNVEVVVRQQSGSDVLALLREGEIDFAVRTTSDTPPDLTFHPFRRAEYLLIAPRTHAIHRMKALTLEQLARHALVLPARGSVARKAIEGAFASRGLSPRIALETGAWDTIKRYAGLGLGVGVVPDFALESSDRRLAARRARSLFAAEVYGILLRLGREPAPAARDLISAIVAPRSL